MKPVEGWGVRVGDVILAVKGCEHPLPCLHVVVKRVHGRKVDPFSARYGWRWSRCLHRYWNIFCPEDYDAYELLDPVARLEGLLDSGFRDAIIEEVYSEYPGYVGVSGSLLWGNPGEARDIDIVVYGVAVRRVYDRLVELRLRGIYKPLGEEAVNEYRVVRRGLGLDEFVKVANNCISFGRHAGRAYSIRFVPCTEPSSCIEPVSVEYVRIRGVLVSGPIPFTPRCALLLAETGVLQWYTLRLTYSCIPSGTVIEAYGRLESYKGFQRFVPDEGFVKLWSL